MAQTDAQIRLRRAFRYGYFAFLALFLGLLVLIGLGFANSGFDAVLVRFSSATSVMLGALVIGLSVPIFFACWSLIASALLGVQAHQPSMLDGIRD